ncbi:MAG: hypothetical protein MJ144_02555 [Clostridia bacterium]|nr:hypothetical protein [Clostridia bacterium]
MKRRLIKITALLLALMTISIGFAGCGNDLAEPDITVDYLQGEFAEMLEKDGADIIIGSVDILEENDTYKARITEKQVVSNDSKKGYYLAETNNLYERVIGSDCRIVYFNGDTPIVGNVKEFLKRHNGETDTIYKTYCFSESCELILPVNPEDLI